jgi:hypothetical protein
MAAKGGTPPTAPKPEGYWGKSGTVRDMGNLPGTMTVGGVSWERTTSTSKEGTYSYGHPDNKSGTISTTAHYTVVPVTKGGKEIYNIHYTNPTTDYRAYYYPGTKTWLASDSKPIPDAIWKQLKVVVDKLYFIWVWYKPA